MKHSQRVVWGFVAPHLSLFSVFLIAPILTVVVLSFYDWNLLGGHRYIGFDNYREILGDARFWRAFRNTAVLCSVVVPVSTVGGFLLAAVLNMPVPGRHFFRAALYLPSAISSVASAVIATWIFDDQYGVLNSFLQTIGIPGIPWLSSPRYALTAVVFTAIWLRIGICMVVYLAALQEIPKDLLDAAALDGASWFQQLRYVVWPSLRPTTTFLLITNVIYSLHIFDLVYVMTDGGPAFSTTVLVQYLYEAAFRELREGYASAISMVLLLLLLSVTGVLLIRRGEHQRSAS